MTRKDKVLGLVGPQGVGDSFGIWLDTLLGQRNLERAVVASAYLTEEAAEHLLACCYGQPRRRSRPVVTVLVGTKDHFTRSAAVQRLLLCSGGTTEARIFPVDLQVLCPTDANFHVKALAATGVLGDVAVLGSHNLTGAGLDCGSELGIAVSGPAAKDVEAALMRWATASAPWRSIIKNYKEARLPSAARSTKPPASRGATSTERLAGSDLEADVSLTDKEMRALKEGSDWFERTAPKLARRVHRYIYGEVAREEVRAEGNYFRGAIFTFSDDYPGESWRLGQERHVLRVVETISVASGKATVVAASKVAKFEVTAENRRIAAKLGLIENQPDAASLAAFVHFLKFGELPASR